MDLYLAQFLRSGASQANSSDRRSLFTPTQSTGPAQYPGRTWLQSKGTQILRPKKIESHHPPPVNLKLRWLGLSARSNTLPVHPAFSFDLHYCIRRSLDLNIHDLLPCCYNEVIVPEIGCCENGSAMKCRIHTRGKGIWSAYK